ncbi:DUF5343 domain-containing protein [Brevundimonas aurifodinae]|uniref:DUF5343 domain-containing protein n=2 Tax=Brevundimonas TaxID=41275 RepID=A0ABV1NP23_9CAUL|nr:MAG: hypothetical protein B7Z01_06155 [Brevundimonas subvibrioides]
MASHPYISGPGNIAQAITLLKRNFPATVTSETIKRFNLASNNESYVINALQFIGVIDAEGKRTEAGQHVFTLHDEKAFQPAFADLVRAAYHDLFDLRGEDAWSLNRNELIGYFRSADKTSEIIGARQAGVFKVLAAVAGFGDVVEQVAPRKPTNERASTRKVVASKREPKSPSQQSVEAAAPSKGGKEISLGVRIEINLPAGASRENYDDIFQSIRANLLNG